MHCGIRPFVVVADPDDWMSCVNARAGQEVRKFLDTVGSLHPYRVTEFQIHAS